jgi:glycosyltransferase involved in cell wall biosynthesis
LILVYTDDPERGGVAQYNHALLLALAGSGYRVACAQAPSSSPLIGAQMAAGVDHHWLPYDAQGSTFRRSLEDMATPRMLFELTRPALVIFSDCCPVSNLAARHAAMALRIPFVVVIGFVAEYLAKSAGSYLGPLSRHYAAAREVIAVSDENLRLLRSHFGLAADRGRVVHYGRPPEFFAPRDPARRAQLRSELGVPADAVVSLTAARLTPLKGYRHQIAAMERLEAGGALAKSFFVWLGEGEERASLEREIRRKGWGRLVALPGHRWNMAEWYDLADLYVLPSESEGMPLSIMEAMAKSLPVIASAISGIPEELGPCGRLIPDPKAHPEEASREMARTIRLWTEDPDLRRAAGDACHDRAGLFFRESTMIQRTLEIVARSASVPAPG